MNGFSKISISDSQVFTEALESLREHFILHIVWIDIEKIEEKKKH